jgi:poly(3-hydroxybutyrate) depolymerase
MMARAGLEIPTNLVAGSLDVGGLRHTYWLARPPIPDAPLLLVRTVAAGPAGHGRAHGPRDARAGAGFAAVFPDGWNHVWIETVARDWAAVNGCAPQPVIDGLPAAPGEPSPTRLTWQTSGRTAVVLYRIEGGGHTWPGGAQYLPERLVGPVARHLDATGILLSFIASR